MPVNAQTPSAPNARQIAAADTLPGTDLTTLDLEALLELPLGGGSPVFVEPTEPPAPAPVEVAQADLTDMSLDQLLTLSLSGGELPQIETADDPAEDETEERPGTDDEEEDEAAPDGRTGGPVEIDFGEAEWLSLEEGLSLRSGGGGENASYQDLLDLLLRQGLRLGDDDPSGLGDLPVPGTLSAGSGAGAPAWNPVLLNLNDGAVAEIWQADDLVGTVLAGGGIGGTVTYSLLDDAGGRFVIDPTSGEVRIAAGAGFDYGSATSHGITVIADNGSQQVTETFAIEVSPGDADGLGQAGTQTLSGAAGNVDDSLYGGGGGDTLFGQNGDDTLLGGSGDDTLFGGNQEDVLFGGGGDDWLLGGNGDDWLHGGTGADLLDGGNHDDLLIGGGGDDRLFGANHDDVLVGGSGDDRLNGEAGSDALYGGLGDDILIWDAADTAIAGGFGTDTLVVGSGQIDLTGFAGTIQGIDVVDLATDPGANTLTLDAADVLSMTDVGVLTVLGGAADSIDAGSGWDLAATTDTGAQVYVQAVGDSVAALLLAPEIQVNPEFLG